MTKKNIITILVVFVILIAGFVGWQQFNARITTNSNASAKKTQTNEVKNQADQNGLNKPKFETPLPNSINSTTSNNNESNPQNTAPKAPPVDVKDDDEQVDSIMKDISSDESSSAPVKK